jgi:starch phosphorylase
MTIAGLKNAGISNAVSKIHAKAAKNIWPNHDLVPVTNGVHMPTWVGKEIHMLLDEYVNPKWFDPVEKRDFSKVANIPNNLLWLAHQAQKKRLIDSLNSQLGTDLKLDVPILSWFRRFTAYKRPDIVISDLARLSEMMNDTNNQVQVLIGGKAHPKDTIGREVMRDIRNTIDQSNFADKVVFLPEYNWQLARQVVAGSDVWVNTPRRHEEASGTSGMKAAANGVLQCTTLDGWTDEIDWSDKGFILDDEHVYDVFYKTIQEQIIPKYRNIDDTGLPNEWIEMMKKTIETVIYNYSSERQLEDYINKLYIPVLKVYSQR